MIEEIVDDSMLDLNISDKRMEICKKCLLYKSTYGGQCNPKLWLNPETGDISQKPKDGYYKGCGCMLAKKTQSSYAHCPAHKW